MMKAGLIDEMMNDSIDSALDTEDIEEETEDQINQVGTGGGMERTEKV
jgi:charged multivesicular body protein 3